MDPRIKEAQNEFQRLANYLLNMEPEEITLLSFSLAYILSAPLTTDQQNAIGNTVILFGQVFLTMNSQRTYLLDTSRIIEAAGNPTQGRNNNFRP